MKWIVMNKRGKVIGAVEDPTPEKAMAAAKKKVFAPMLYNKEHAEKCAAQAKGM